MTLLKSFRDRMFPNNGNNTFHNRDLEPVVLYDKLKVLYDGNGAYDDIAFNANLLGIPVEAIKSLRTVVNRSVEFYVSRILPNPTVIADKEAVQQAIEQFYKWSNFKSKKQVLCRNLSLYGDLFLKVASDESKVYFENINPRYVTEFDVDVRGYITEIRIDIPIEKDGREMTYTEYWSKEEDYYATWEHGRGADAKLENLGEPIDFGALGELGIDFVPVVYIKFKDAGDARGQGCVSHALDKIDEANRQATTLPQRLYRYGKPIYAVMANSVDSSGKFNPPPKLNGGVLETTLTDDASVMYFPGMSKMESLIPNIPYQDALNILNAQMTELEQDLPELRFYSLKDSQISGKAISQLLGGAIARAEEAKDNLIEGLERLNYMALTIGRYLGFFPRTVGTFENEDFAHSIQTDAMIEEDEGERATLLKTLVDAGVPLTTAMGIAGYDEETIAEVETKKQDEQANQNAGLAQAMLGFNRGQ
jgi:hypothetical protein